MPYFTQRLVDDFASHIRLYRRASEKAKSSRNDGKIHYLVINVGHYIWSRLDQT